MRCDRCPLCPIAEDDVCAIAETKEYGIEHKDGMLGCRHSWNWCKKKADEYADYLGKMADGMMKMMEEEHKADVIREEFLDWLFDKEYVRTDNWDMWHLGKNDILREFKEKKNDMDKT